MRPRSVDFSQFNSSLAVTFWRFCSIEIRLANRTDRWGEIFANLGMVDAPGNFVIGIYLSLIRQTGSN
jgi:hypothetical protein